MFTLNTGEVSVKAEREKQFDSLRKQVGRTPLIEIQYPKLENGNRLFAKCEFLNPTYSHHDRQYVELFYEAEKSGSITPGVTPIIETTSGSAGISFAWIAKELGYDATVIVPSELPSSRIEDIKKFGGKLIISEGKYLLGSINKLKTILLDDRDKQGDKSKRYYFINHSRKEVSSLALESIATETLEQCPECNTYIGILGSGSSISGPAKVFLDSGVNVVAWEPFGSAHGFDQQNPSEYLELFGIKPGEIPHNIFGGSFVGADFPHINSSVEMLKNKIVLVADQYQISNYEKFISDNGLNNPDKLINNVRSLIQWDKIDPFSLPVGYTSLGNLAVALNYSKTTSNEKIVIVLYDPITRY